MMKRCLPLLLLVLAARGLPAEQFRFKYTPDRKYRILSEVFESVSINGVFSHQANILNKIAVETLAVKEASGLLSCTFQTSERAFGARSSFELSEDYPSLFWRDELGRYAIDPAYFMPVVRNVPPFPQEDVPQGGTWSAAGEEVQDLRRSYGIEKAFHFPVKVSYRYAGREVREGSFDFIFHLSDGQFVEYEGTAWGTASPWRTTAARRAGG